MSEEVGMWAQAEQTSFCELSGSEFAVKDLKLPQDFIWGAATAAYQVEGAASQDGKEKLIWDVYSHLEPSRTNGDNADVTCDHYDRFEEDVKLMKSLGIETYRFSLALSRIIPLAENIVLRIVGFLHLPTFLSAGPRTDLVRGGMFLASRLILGTGIPFAVSGASQLFAELTYPRERAVITGLFNTSLFIGAIMAAGVTLGTHTLPNDWGWRIPSILQGAPSVLQLIFI